MKITVDKKEGRYIKATIETEKAKEVEWLKTVIKWAQDSHETEIKQEYINL